MYFFIHFVVDNRFTTGYTLVHKSDEAKKRVSNG